MADWKRGFGNFVLLVGQEYNLHNLFFFYQCGFVKGKSTVDHIFTLRQTMEKYYEFDKDLYMLFVDYKQAYDRVNRKELWKAMILFGIPQKYVNLIKMYNDKTLLKVRFLQRLSPAFEVNSGLR